jgi:hypothetical protein
VGGEIFKDSHEQILHLAMLELKMLSSLVSMMWDKLRGNVMGEAEELDPTKDGRTSAAASTKRSHNKCSNFLLQKIRSHSDRMSGGGDSFTRGEKETTHTK